jgi:hypothetical protein
MSLIWSEMTTESEDLAHIRKQVDRIVRCLYGNGALGIVTRVALMEASTRAHGKNWSSLIEMIIRDVLIAAIMWMLLKQA